MADEELPKKQRSLVPIFASLAIASLTGAILFGLVYSGTILSKTTSHDEMEVEEETVATEHLPPVSFLPIEPLLITLGAAANGRQLRFEGYLEVKPGHIDEIEQLMPRIMDVLNTYLRAVDYTDVSEPSSLLKLRLQMLKRVQIVVGEGKVNDLLVSKFVLS